MTSQEQQLTPLPGKAPKERLDQLCVLLGLAESRTQAQAYIMAGNVLVGTERVTKPGHKLPVDAPVTLKEKLHPWVSRGGMKLAHGLAHFGIDVAGMCALDIGASTGGFTDVLLHNGAREVFAVDVGTAQLAWKLRSDPRVHVLEKTNARHLTPEHIPAAPDILVCDASFISLKTVLPAGMALCATRAHMLVLIKPQFEAGREHVGKGGVVRDEAIHTSVCANITTWVDMQGWQVQGISESPITGPCGNKEFLLYAVRGD